MLGGGDVSTVRSDENCGRPFAVLGVLIRYINCRYSNILYSRGKIV